MSKASLNLKYLVIAIPPFNEDRKKIDEQKELVMYRNDINLIYQLFNTIVGKY